MKETKQNGKRGKLNLVVGIAAIILIIVAVATYKPQSVLDELTETPAPTVEVTAAPEPVQTPEPTPEPASATPMFTYRDVHLEPKHGSLNYANVLESDNTLSVLVEETQKESIRMPIEYSYENLIDFVLNQACHVYNGIGYSYYAYTQGGMFDEAISFYATVETIQGIAKGEINADNIAEHLEDLYINQSFYA